MSLHNKIKAILDNKEERNKFASTYRAKILDPESREKVVNDVKNIKNMYTKEFDEVLKKINNMPNNTYNEYLNQYNATHELLQYVDLYIKMVDLCYALIDDIRLEIDRIVWNDIYIDYIMLCDVIFQYISRYWELSYKIMSNENYMADIKFFTSYEVSSNINFFTNPHNIKSFSHKNSIIGQRYNYNLHIDNFKDITKKMKEILKSKQAHQNIENFIQDQLKLLDNAKKYVEDINRHSDYIEKILIEDKYDELFKEYTNKMSEEELKYIEFSLIEKINTTD